MRLSAALLTGLLLSAALVLNARSPRDQSVSPDSTHWVKLTFGLDGENASWDGSAGIRDGEILRSAPWSFEKRDRFNPGSHQWFCTTVVKEGRSASSFAEPQRGVLLQIERSGQPQLEIETRQGNFTVAVDDLRAGRPTEYLNGRASAELLGTSKELPDRTVDSDAVTEDDFPALAVDEEGHRWIAWIGYEDAAKRDHLWTLNLDDPNAVAEEIRTAREQLDPHLMTDADGTLWLFWSAPQDGNWDLWASNRTGHGWSSPQRITTAEGTDFHLDAARGPQGEIWLAWQSFRNGNGDVFAKRLKGGRWSDDFAVTQHDANDWQPSVGVDPEGTVWVGYDSYRNGNYDVFLSSVRIDKSGRQAATVGEPTAVAASADFEAHAAVEAAGDGTVWVACDAAGPNWGKDFTRDSTTFRGQYGEPLHASRRLKLRAVVDGRVKRPAVPLPQKLNVRHPENVNHSQQDQVKRFYELPQLARDGDGRLWVVFRLNRQGYAGHPKRGAVWEIFATTFVDGDWLQPILLPLSRGRQNQRIATAVGPDGRLQAAWSTGHHQVDIPQTVRVGKLPPVAGSPESPPLEPVDPPAPEPPEPEPHQDVVDRGWEMHHRGETYRVYFGDLHRHTDISLCTPTVDGSLVDAYRYALDAARLDFLAVTDHTRDTDPFPWWRTQKANDLFHVPGRLATIYAYERSNRAAGGGHRNVFFLERGWPVLRSDAHYGNAGLEPPQSTDPDVSLYPKLRGKDAFTAAHTPRYARGAEKGTWTFHDPQVEPLAEILQSYRRDYVRPGRPEWPEARIRNSLSEEASVWYALAKGHKLGFIASSDHHATHTSYAAVWAKSPSREDIFNALRSRRTYAATDKILLDVRMGDAVLGEQIEAPRVPELRIRVRGTAPIEEIQIVRNRTVISSTSPDKAEVETRFRDEEYPGGAAYYYVRVRQSDNNMAWGSPIWIR